MNLANIMTVIFCLMTAMLTNAVFSNFWFTPWCARVPFKRIQWKWALAIPGALAVIGTFSFFDSDWSSPISLMPKLVVISVYVTTIWCLIRWYRAPDSLNITIDFVVKHYWFYALRIDFGKYHPENSTNRKILDANDVFVIPCVYIESAYCVYLSFLKSIGQVNVQDIVCDSKVGVKMCAFETQEENHPDIKYLHTVMSIPEQGIIAFSSEHKE